MKLSSIFSTPCNWSSQTDEVIEVDLPSYHSEYKLVFNLLNGVALQNLEKITRIQNPLLYHRYEVKKLEYEALKISFNEKNLLHATAASKVSSIIEDNLDWRLVCRAKFGQGVSFSPYASYANKECSRSNGFNRAIIVAKVIIGNKYPGNCLTRYPPKGYDTTYGNGSNVIVKYYDDEFYPAYAAYYHL